jgi:hypothetical protein
MKNSIWHLSFTLLISLALTSSISTCIYGQQPQPPSGEHGSGVGSATCDNPPCAQLPNDGRPVSITTGKHHPIHTPTPEQIERREQEMRYGGLFASLEADEQLAQRLEAAGDTSNAASWRADFARKSGLTPEEAEIVKKIAAQYRQDQISLNADCRTDLLAAQKAYAVVRTAGSKFPEIPTCDKLRNLFPKVLADLVTALGSRSFSQLDGYALHLDDNARILYRQRQPANGQSQKSPATAETVGSPK